MWFTTLSGERFILDSELPTLIAESRQIDTLIKYQRVIERQS